MRKTIYVPDDGVVIWDEICSAAKAQNRSVSNYLINLHLEFGRSGELKKMISEMPKQIEKTHTQEVSEKEPEETVKELMTPVTVSRDELIAPLKEKIEKIQGKPIVGYSKDRQLGKKGNK